MSDRIVAGLVAAMGKIEGRVKLQKIVYLLEEMGYELGYDDYVFLLHGPYSEDLAADLDRASGVLLRESRRPSGLFFAATGEQVMRYEYEPRDLELAKGLLKLLRSKFGGRSDQLVERIAELNSITAPILELVASAIYFREREGVHDPEAIWQRVQREKEHLARHFARAQRQLLEWDKKGFFRAQTQ